ncbi:uncharacterized protein LOC106652409 isoform X3 [Trichogramma pretiosum]|nr:uncharacterized protein LOC106652409 isoform X3 [Trichogramma pretiosum]
MYSQCRCRGTAYCTHWQRLQSREESGRGRYKSNARDYPRQPGPDSNQTGVKSSRAQRRKQRKQILESALAESNAAAALEKERAARRQAQSASHAPVTALQEVLQAQAAVSTRAVKKEADPKAEAAVADEAWRKYCVTQAIEKDRLKRAAAAAASAVSARPPWTYSKVSYESQKKRSGQNCGRRGFDTQDCSFRCDEEYRRNDGHRFGRNARTARDAPYAARPAPAETARPSVAKVRPACPPSCTTTRVNASKSASASSSMKLESDEDFKKVATSTVTGEERKKPLQSSSDSVDKKTKPAPLLAPEPINAQMVAGLTRLAEALNNVSAEVREQVLLAALNPPSSAKTN